LAATFFILFSQSNHGVKAFKINRVSQIGQRKPSSWLRVTLVSRNYPCGVLPLGGVKLMFFVGKR
jgi:hypothetical protein